MKKSKKIVAKNYKLKANATPLAYMLSSHHSKRSNLLYFDEDSGTNRALCYARNQKSPFQDEHDGNAILEPIVFEDGFLHVIKQNQVLQEFLNYHPGNGTIFEEVNQARDAQEELDVENLILEAQLQARDLSIEKLATIGRVLIGANADAMSTAELKRDVLVFARNNPMEFMEVLEDPTLQVQDDVVLFFQNGLLALRNKGKDIYFNTKTNKKKMLSVPFGEEPEYMVANYFMSDDGIEVYKVLKKSL
tara:strand:+ start:77 stop:820 length:744 start_codon:yes stop_codon:yes gene_type:complete